MTENKKFCVSFHKCISHMVFFPIFTNFLLSKPLLDCWFYCCTIWEWEETPFWGKTCSKRFASSSLHECFCHFRDTKCRGTISDVFLRMLKFTRIRWQLYTVVPYLEIEVTFCPFPPVLGPWELSFPATFDIYIYICRRVCVWMTERVLGFWGVYSNTQHLCAMKAPLFGKIPFKQ